MAEQSNLFIRRGIYYARFEIDGRDVKKSLGTSNEREAKRLLKELIARYREPARQRKVLGVRAITLPDAIANWHIAAAADRTKPRTILRYGRSWAVINRYIAEELKRNPDTMLLSDLNMQFIRDYISWRMKQGAVSNVKRDLTAMSVVLRLGVSQGYASENAARDYDRKVLKERRKVLAPPTVEEVQEFVKKAPPLFGRVAAFLRLTGMRQEEALLLEWRQVNWQDKQLLLTFTKTSQPRVIELSEEAVAMLREQEAAGYSKRYVFAQASGKPFRNYASNFRTKAKRYGLGFRCHDLRHAFAIAWLKSGESIYRLQFQLGHTSIKTTEVYLRFLSAEEQLVARGLKTRNTSRSMQWFLFRDILKPLPKKAVKD
jgi:integrase/recombinase XerD